MSTQEPTKGPIQPPVEPPQPPSVDASPKPPVPKQGKVGLRVLVFAVAFLILSIPLVVVVAPESPAWVALAKQHDAPTMAIIGDSRAHVGVAPRLLVEELGKAGYADVTAYNFAVDGTDVLHHRSFVVNALLRVAHPPKVVVLATHPLSFDDGDTNNRLDQLTTADLWPLLKAGAPLEMVLDVATMRWLPPYRHRPPVKAKLEDLAFDAGVRLTALQRLIGLAFDPRKARKYTTYEDGQVPFRVLNDWPGVFAESMASYGGRWQRLSVGRVQMSFARDLARRAREQGVVLVILELPVSPSFRAVMANGAGYVAWRAFVNSLVRDEGAVFLSHVDHYSDDHVFGDVVHMHEDTAAEYSRFLAHALMDDPTVRAALAAKKAR